MPRRLQPFLAMTSIPRALLVILCCGLSPCGLAQVVPSVDSGQPSSGTVVAINAELLTIAPAGGGMPRHFVHSRTTEWVSPDGTRLPLNAVKVDAAVTIHSMQQGPKAVAKRVVLEPTQPTPQLGAATPAAAAASASTAPALPKPVAPPIAQTASSAVGTLSAVNANALVLSLLPTGELVTYLRNESTQFVDDKGATFDPTQLRPGTAVDVHFVAESERRLARRVVVRESASQAPGTASAVGPGAPASKAPPMPSETRKAD